MDSLTHIFFAHKLLYMAGENTSAAICSLFPQIDREPAYLHRMYAHPFFQISRLAEIGTYVYNTGEIQSGFEKDFDWKRFHDDLPRMKWFAKKFEEETQYKLSKFWSDKLSVLIAYVSHTYQDIFNNPMQAFLPQWVYPCGQWELWSELGAVDFRTVLYVPENISALREELFGASLWTAKANGSALIKAMINRTATTGVLKVPQNVVDNAFESLGLNFCIDPIDLKFAEEILIEHEVLLTSLIRKYSDNSISKTRLKGDPIKS
jgi:hypothetical protein